MKAYFERAQRLMDQKKAEEEKLKQLLLQFNVAKEAGDTILANQLKRRIEHMAKGGLPTEPQFRQYTKEEIKAFEATRNREV
jgi:hypothetical protein